MPKEEEAPLLNQPAVLSPGRTTFTGRVTEWFVWLIWWLLPRAFTRPSVTALRRMLSFPASADTFPDREVFDEMWDRLFAGVRDGGDKWRKLSYTGVLINSVVVFMNLRIRKRLLQMPPVPPVRAGPRQRVFIIGLFRTGTTLLQRLLGACSEVYTPTLRQLKNPAAPGEVPLGGLLGFTRAFTPWLLAIHPMEPDEPDECAAPPQTLHTTMHRRPSHVAHAVV